MLNRTSIEAALPVAQRLAERNLRVLPSQNSPLLSVSMAVDNTLVNIDLGENVDIVAVLQGRTSGEQHQIAKADIIRLASASISRLHDITRNQVLPLIKDVTDRAQTYIDERRMESSLPYQVVMREIPAVFSNPALRQLVDRYPQPSNIDYVVRNLAPVTFDRVKDLVKTGMAGFDEELAASLSVKNGEGYAVVMDVLQGRVGVQMVAIDYLPGILVAAQAIYDAPEAGVAMTLVEYNDNVNRLLGKTAQLLRGALMRTAEQERLGILYSTEGRDSLTKIVVMGKAYRALLDKGLTPEALTGNEMAARKYTQGQLIENKALLENIYNREMNLQAIKVQSAMAGITREALRVVIGQFINERLTGEEAVNAVKLFAAMASKINSHNCDDLATLTAELVTEIFFPRTDSLTMIRLINRVGATLDEDTDPREIALLATIKYINHWLCRQIGITQA